MLSVRRKKPPHGCGGGFEINTTPKSKQVAAYPTISATSNRIYLRHPHGKLLEALAAGQKLILWLDDAHWADPDSLAFIQLLYQKSRSQGCVIATHWQREWQQAAQPQTQQRPQNLMALLNNNRHFFPRPAFPLQLSEYPAMRPLATDAQVQLLNANLSGLSASQ